MGDIEQGNITKPISPRQSSAAKSSSCTSVNCSLEEEDDELDLERGGDVAVVVEVEKSKEMSVRLSKKVEDEVEERDCRICHLSLVDGSSIEEYGSGIELGCCCKEDLAAAHIQCAETWFKIRGNKTCEICGSIARNVVGVNEVELMEQYEANDPSSTAAIPSHPAETRHFWQGHKFLNFLLACMVFAFVISWLFHFNVPS